MKHKKTILWAISGALIIAGILAGNTDSVPEAILTAGVFLGLGVAGWSLAEVIDRD